MLEIEEHEEQAEGYVVLSKRRTAPSILKKVRDAAAHGWCVCCYVAEGKKTPAASSRGLCHKCRRNFDRGCPDREEKPAEAAEYDLKQVRRGLVLPNRQGRRGTKNHFLES